MDNEDNLFDDDLLDISLDDLSTEDLEEPADKKPDEDVIELVDLVEKGDEDMIDLDETKPLFNDKVTAGSPDSKPGDMRDQDDFKEIGDTAEISRSDLTLGDMLLETGTSEPGTETKNGEGIDLDISEEDDEEGPLDDTVAYNDVDSDDSPGAEDISDELMDESGSEDIAEDEDNAFYESSDDLFSDDEEMLGESTGDLNAAILEPLEDEEPADDSQPDDAMEESYLSDGMEEEAVSANDDQSVDEKIQLSDVSLKEEFSSEEDSIEESVEDSIIPVENGDDVIEKEVSDEIIDAASDEYIDRSYEAGPAIVPEEKIEEIVTRVVGEVVEKVARQVFTEVAEKIITEAIEGLKKSLEADSE